MIFSIGQGSRTVQELAAHLCAQKVQFLIDVRSKPYSRYNPEFSQGALACHLRDAGIRYVFMGDQIGGLPNDPACYTDGKVDYDKCHAHPIFRAGVQRLRSAHAQDLRVCLFCSEGDPSRCHRSKLIGVALKREDITLTHILRSGRTATQDDVIRRLTGGQTELFEPAGFTSRKRYAPTGVRERFTLENPHPTGESFTLENPHPSGESFTLEGAREGF